MSVRPKKHFGQHFLIDPSICEKVASQYSFHNNCMRILEIGPGMGALTEQLLKLYTTDTPIELTVMEIDPESCEYLRKNFPILKERIIHADFIQADIEPLLGKEPFSVIGNFPYNISSQILFRCFELRDQIPEIVGMFQKEVAERIAHPPGSKQYGILSVFIQTFYDVNYCFSIDEDVFFPKPKVKSGVIRCTRNTRTKLPCDEELFVLIVKMGFNQRRKTLRNALKKMIAPLFFEHPLLDRRAESLNIEEFIELTIAIEHKKYANKL